MVAGYGPSVVPQVFGPFVWQTNNQIVGYDNNALGLTPGVKGIQFNSPQAPSSNVNVLDDYAEGTFTPTIIGLTTAGVGTYSSQSGSYTKIGNEVYFKLSLAWSAHTGTGAMAVTGLPFTAGAGDSPPVAIVPSSLTFPNQLGAYVLAGSVRIDLVTFATGGAVTSLPIDTAASLQIAGSYTV